MTTNAARKMACWTLTMDRVALAELDDAAMVARIAASFDGNDDCGDEDEDGSHDKRGQRNERDLDPNRGAAWLGAERAAEIGLLADEPKKKRRNRKSRDDQ